MAPLRRPGLTIISREASPDDPMAVLIWTAVPVEHCTFEMLAFRRDSEPYRVEDEALFTRMGLPTTDNPEHPTIRHWQSGGVVLFGYKSSRQARYAMEVLDAVYIAHSGRIAIRGA